MGTRRKQYAGSRRKISSGDWNGFLDMYRDYYQGDAGITAVPRILHTSTIVNCVLATGQDPIPGYSPCRIVKSTNVEKLGDGETTYEVVGVDEDGYGYHGNYGFTLGEGVDSEFGGRIVIGGIAVVQITRDQLYDASIPEYSDPLTGEFDSVYYSCPDETISADPDVVIGPVGHYKLVSFYDVSSITDYLPTAESLAFVAIDMSARPGRVAVKTTEEIGAATGSDPELVLGVGEANVYVTNDSRELGEGITTTINEDFILNIYNGKRSTVSSSADVFVEYSEAYNGMLIAESSLEVRFGKMNATIQRGDTDGVVDLWDDAADPPTDLSEQIGEVRFVWLSQQQISAGKEVAIVRVGPYWHVLWAECEDDAEEDVEVSSSSATLDADAGGSQILVSYTDTGSVALSLPSAASAYAAGKEFTIIDTGANASSNNITVNRDGSDTITTTTTGQTSATISTDGGSLKLRPISSTVWKVV